MTEDVKSTTFSRPNAKRSVESVLVKPIIPPRAAIVVKRRDIHDSQNAGCVVCVCVGWEKKV